MKKFFGMILLIVMSCTTANATVMQAGISANETVKNYCTVIDKFSRKPVSNAKITIPSKNYTAYSDINGHFEIKTPINSQTILAVEKNNYKPFSMTINRGDNIRPIVVEIEKANSFDITVDSKLCHLGDNNYSVYSANSGEFKGTAVGSIYNKKFFISGVNSSKPHYLVIGSIIGIDTPEARRVGQSSVTTSFATPPIVYLNGQKIAVINVNGDNQKIKLPKELIKWNQNNIITIKAGINLMQTSRVDFDDIEFMNLSIESGYDSTQRISNRYHLGY